MRGWPSASRISTVSSKPTSRTRSTMTRGPSMRRRRCTGDRDLAQSVRSRSWEFAQEKASTTEAPRKSRLAADEWDGRGWKGCHPHERRSGLPRSAGAGGGATRVREGRMATARLRASGHPALPEPGPSASANGSRFLSAFICVHPRLILLLLFMVDPPRQAHPVLPAAAAPAGRALPGPGPTWRAGSGGGWGGLSARPGALPSGSVPRPGGGSPG